MPEKLLKTAICTDNHKLDKFKEELTAAGLEFKIYPLADYISQIHIQCPPEKIEELKTLAIKIMAHFKNLNTN